MKIKALVDAGIALSPQTILPFKAGQILKVGYDGLLKEHVDDLLKAGWAKIDDGIDDVADKLVDTAVDAIGDVVDNVVDVVDNAVDELVEKIEKKKKG